MSDTPRMTRRNFLRTTLGAGAGLVGAGLGAPEAGAAARDATPEQTEGPFFPATRRADEDLDLTVVKGRKGRAAGDVLYVRGRVLDEEGAPVADALVEIWQANSFGRYEHERDAGNPRKLDPNFQGWARVLTGPDGRFAFKTIKPGAYPADGRGWMRPPHIHYKVSRRGFHELTTQMYIEGEPLNDADNIRRGLTPDERAQVTVRFAAAKDAEPSARAGAFEITIRRVV